MTAVGVVATVFILSARHQWDAQSDDGASTGNKERTYPTTEKELMEKLPAHGTDSADKDAIRPSKLYAEKGPVDEDPAPGVRSHPWPDDIENLMWEYFAHQPGLELTSIVSVECSERTCEIMFTGTDVNPRYVDEFEELLFSLYSKPWNVYQGSIALQEISPGVKAFVVRVSNVEFEEPDDAEGAPTEKAAAVEN